MISYDTLQYYLYFCDHIIPDYYTPDTEYQSHRSNCVFNNYEKLIYGQGMFKNGTYLLRLMNNNCKIKDYIEHTIHSFISLDFINKDNTRLDLRNDFVFICINPKSKLFLRMLKVHYEPLSQMKGEVSIVFQTMYNETIEEFDGIKYEEMHNQSFVNKFIDDYLSETNALSKDSKKEK